MTRALGARLALGASSPASSAASAPGGAPGYLMMHTFCGEQTTATFGQGLTAHARELWRSMEPEEQGPHEGEMQSSSFWQGYGGCTWPWDSGDCASGQPA